MKPILIVDDDRDIRDSLRETLQAEGYETADASDGGEALAYLRDHEVSLVLLDWNMSPVDAPAFMVELVKHERQPPIILLTADSRVTSRGELDGYVAVLKKPVNLTRLFELAQRYYTAG